MIGRIDTILKSGLLSDILPKYRRPPSMTRPELRVVVVGCGPIGALHAAAVRSSPVARLAGVCDLVRDRAQGLAQRLGGGVLATDRLDVLLGCDAADVVTVATPDHLHVEVAMKAIAAGCDVFCEKPLAATLVDARRLVAAAGERGVTLGVDYNRRFGFGYRIARGLLEAGKLGDLRQVVFQVLDRTPQPDVARVPEVILTTLLTHHIDLARWFAGEVASIGARFGPVDSAGSGLRRDLVLTLGFATGAMGVIVAGYRDGQTRTTERADIIGSLGTVRVDEVTRSATFWTNDPDRREVFEPGLFSDEGAFDGTVREHVCAFLERLAAGEPPPVSGGDGLRGLELAEAALRSHAEGRLLAV
jgi:myo-inositol 2-dehydrogenase/D-chiro-inositol 1-dehydrogenase